MRKGIPEPSRDSSQKCSCGAMFLWRIWTGKRILYFHCELCDTVDGRKKKRRGR